MRFLILLPLLLMASCSWFEEKDKTMKSPCVGIEDSPCGPKRPVNDWWMKG